MHKYLLIIIIISAFIIRLYRIDAPLADWHSWRQADTAAVARNFIKNGIDLLHPTYDDISSTQSGMDNPNGYRMVEFPIYNAIVAIFTQTNTFSLEIWGRLISILSSIGSLIFLYLIVKKHSDNLTALFAAFFFAFIPYNIFFSRTILPEPSMTFCFLAAIYLFDRNLIILSAIFASLALLIKVTAIFFLLPIVYLIYSRNLFKKLNTYIFFVITFVPILLWRLWIQNFPEGIPASSWLLNGGNIRFKGAFFRWIIAERMGKLILAYGGFVLFWLGIILKPIRKNIFFYTLLLSSVTYVVIFARGNVQHDYYQIPIIPSLAIFMALGARELWDRSKIILLCLVLMILGFGWYEIRGDFNINHPEIVEAGKVVDQITPPNALVIAPYEGDTAFLYQTKRKGWPIGGDIDSKIQKGAEFYVSNSFNDETNTLMQKYQVVDKTDKFVIIKLK